MDMSVTSYDRSVLTDAHEFSEVACYDAGHVQALAPSSDYAWALEGLEIGRCYSIKEASTKRIGSSVEAYTGWVDRLMQGANGVSLEDVWVNPSIYPAVRFGDLAKFVFGERGLFGPVVAARVALDFKQELPVLAKVWKREPQMTHLLLTWLAIFENASSGEGLVLYR